MMGCRVHGEQGLVTVFLFASHKHRKFLEIENIVKINLI